ncbi:MAG TPA: hypothetical protein VFL59_15765 [Candidatus Nanopelagicales bacterium]|nr:hypothetical protein [Candidatus Nanopelagicales bacterium]
MTGIRPAVLAAIAVAAMSACSTAARPGSSTSSLSPMEKELGCDLRGYVEDPGSTGADPAAAVQSLVDAARSHGVDLEARPWSPSAVEGGYTVFLLFRDGAGYGTVEVARSGSSVWTAHSSQLC